MYDLKWYWDDYGLLRARPREDVENGVMFTALWDICKHEVSSPMRALILQTHRDHKGMPVMTPTDSRPASHDNQTSLLYFYKKHTGLVGKVNWKKYWHPRDVLFYHALRHKWVALFLFPFMLESALPGMKFRMDFKGGGVWEAHKYETDGDWIELFITLGKIRIRIMRSLDGKLLNIIRMRALGMPWIEKTIRAVWTLCYGRNYQDYFFRFYFRNKFHPLLSTYSPPTA